MNIIYKDEKGQRQSLEMPCAHIVRRSPKDQQKSAVAVVCGLLGIKPKAS